MWVFFTETNCFVHDGESFILFCSELCLYWGQEARYIRAYLKRCQRFPAPPSSAYPTQQPAILVPIMTIAAKHAGSGSINVPDVVVFLKRVTFRIPTITPLSETWQTKISRNSSQWMSTVCVCVCVCGVVCYAIACEIYILILRAILRWSLAVEVHFDRL